MGLRVTMGWRKYMIYKKDDNLIIEIPLTTRRFCPYSQEKKEGMKNIVALINKEEMGFAKYIDMDYKGKADQWTSLFYQYWGEQKDFEMICEEIGIDVLYE